MQPDFMMVESGAHEAATSPHNQRRPPTDAQAKAGNYKKGRITLHGLNIAIENPRGTYRSGRNPDTGLRWTSQLAAHYGYFPGTLGNDGDPVDCFVGEWIYADKVYVVNQFFGEKFDEHKCMVGFADKESAKIAYQLSFNQGWSCLKSITPCTITQFRWWLANGNKNKPLYPDHLPYEGTNTMQMIHWTPDANPGNIEIGRLLYNMRKDTVPEQGDLLMDAATIADIEADMADWADEVITMDAIVVEFKDLSKRLGMMQKAMNRMGGELQVTGYDASKPATKAGVTHIAAVFSLSDGQSLSIYFHNPDTTPKTIKPTDELISWKALLNKKDVTAAVAPESGKIMSEIDVAKRMFKLAEKNSASFQRQSGKNAEKAANIDALNTEIAGLEKELTSKQKQLEAAKIAATVAPDIATTPDPIEQPSPPAEPAVEPETQTPAQDETDSQTVEPQQAEPEFIPTHTLRDGAPESEAAGQDQENIQQAANAKYADRLEQEAISGGYVRTLELKLSPHGGREIHAVGDVSGLQKEGVKTIMGGHDAIVITWSDDEGNGFERQYAKPFDFENLLDFKDAYTDAPGNHTTDPEISTTQEETAQPEQEDPPKESLIDRMRIWADELIDGKYASFQGFVISSLNDYSDDEKTEMYEYLGLVKGKSNFDDFKKALRKYWDSRSGQRTKRKKKTKEEATEASIRILMQRAQAEHDLMMGDEEDPYAARIEALRTMPRSEYDDAIDTLIAELEAAGVLDKYEAMLTEIDVSRTHELEDIVAKATTGKTFDSATTTTVEDFNNAVKELAAAMDEETSRAVDEAIKELTGE